MGWWRALDGAVDQDDLRERVAGDHHGHGRRPDGGRAANDPAR